MTGPLAPDARPRLARRARLRRDPVGDGMLLLWPERGMALNDTAAATLSLCDGSRELAAIVARLAADHRTTPEAIEADVHMLLTDLRARGLVELVP